MLSLILAEAALELIPREIVNHPSVRSHTLRTGKRAEELLLDRSIHHSAMRGLKEGERRGRPDLIYISLLTILSTPLYLHDRVEVYLHTIDDKVIRIEKGVRLPRSYFRFEALVEQLFRDGAIGGDGRTLLSIKEMRFGGLIEEIGAVRVIGLSSIGRRSNVEMVARELSKYNDAAVVIGGFPRGHFPKRVLDAIDVLYSVHRMKLDAHVVCSRMLYEYERQKPI